MPNNKIPTRVPVEIYFKRKTPRRQPVKQIVTVQSGAKINTFVASFKTSLQKIWGWIKANGSTILFAVVGILGAGIAFKYHRKRVNELQSHIEVIEASAKISELNARREVLEKDAKKHVVAIANIDKKLLDNKRAIVELHEFSEPLSDAEVLKAYKDLGY